MKAITILQPYASLIACGEKRYETRSWPTKYRGRIAIHAGLGQQWDIMLMDDDYFEALVRGGITTIGKRYPNLPHGFIVAFADITDCLKITEYYGEHSDGVLLENNIKIDRNEMILGNYYPGRYAWKLENIHMLKTPIPAKGQQGLWTWDDAAAKNYEGGI